MAQGKKLFTVGEGHDNIVLNYHGHPLTQFALIAGSYFEAATALRQKFEAELHTDFDTYPIVFLYRHALELFLKAILLLGNRLAVITNNPQLRTGDVFKNHSLSDNLPVIKAIFAEVGWEDDYQCMGLDSGSFEAIVKEFDQLDYGSDTFRYTAKKDGTANLKNHFVFSIPKFAAIMQPILTSLSGACLGLEEISSCMAEQYREQMAEMRIAEMDIFP
jgi:hypothetical protein